MEMMVFLVINLFTTKSMKKINSLLSVACVLSLSATVLSSCSSNDFGESTNVSTDGTTVTFKVNKGFAEDDVTRAAQPQTERIILADGLLVDATLSDEGGTAGTRATGTTYTSIPDNSKGVAFVCDASGTIVKQQNVTVTGSAISVEIPGTGSYTIYFYITEGGTALTTSAFTGAGIGQNISKVLLASRANGTKDDYAKATGISSATTTIQNDGTNLTFTPIGSEVYVTTNAGIAPITGFATTVTGIQATEATNIKISDGTYTISPTAATDGQSMSNDNSSNATTIYASSLASNSVRFFSLNQTNAQKATLTINSISGPDGTSANRTKSYTGGNTMAFTKTYQSGHRYNLVLNLATPINGYVEVGTTDGVQTGEIKGDDNTKACALGIVDATATPGYQPSYTAEASWPCIMGRPVHYEWDAKAHYPVSTSKTRPSTSFASNSQANAPSSIPTPTNPGTTVAQYCCAKCPTYNQISWYLKGGSYYDAGCWYCPNGFLNQVYTKTAGYKDIIVHTGGRWFKKLAKIDGYAASNKGATPAYSSGTTVQTNAATLQTGKPGVIKLTSNDANQQDPNDWFFLPFTGWYGDNGFQSLDAAGYYWSSVPGNKTNLGWRLDIFPNQAKIDFGTNDSGHCLWLPK
jgi:hypothetical protein